MKLSRGFKLKGGTYKIETGCGSLYVTINKDPSNTKPQEIFINMGKAGGCVASQVESLGRTIALLFRCGIPIQSIFKQLKGIRCHRPIHGGAQSCTDGVSILLEQFSKGE